MSTSRRCLPPFAPATRRASSGRGADLRGSRYPLSQPRRRLPWNTPVTARIAALLVFAGCSGGSGQSGDVGTAAPDLKLSMVSHSPATLQEGQPLQVMDTVFNEGSVPAGPFRVGIYASTDETITTDDTLLGYRNVTGLSNGDSKHGSGDVTASLAPGTWFIGVVADDDKGVNEGNEGNNAMVSGTNGGQLLVTAAATRPDLVVDTISHSAASVEQGQVLTFYDSVRNAGPAQAGPFRVGIYASTDATIDVTDTLLGFRAVDGLASQASSGASGSFAISLAPGMYFIGARADYQNSVTESAEGNNTRVSSYFSGQLLVTAATSAADLAMTSLTHAPASVQAGQSVSIGDTVRNQGSAAAGSFRVGIYASTDNIISTSDMLLGYRTVGGLGSGASSNANTSLVVILMPGTYFLGAIADHDNSVVEANESNNAMLSSSSAQQLTVTAATSSPDLRVTALTNGTAPVQAGNPVSFSDTVQNIGSASAGSFRVGIYASTNNVITTTDTLLGYRIVSSLGVGMSDSGLGSFPINLAAGTYYIGAFVDYLGEVTESDESNNTFLSTSASGQLTVTPPPNVDLIMTVLTHGSQQVQQGGSVTISDTVYNQGSTTAGQFRVGIYASPDSTITTGDTLLVQRTVFSLAAAASNSNGPTPLTISLSPGTWWIGAIADYQNTVAESNESNNTIGSSWYSGQLLVTAVVTQPDLRMTALTHTPSSVQAGQSVSFSDTVQNQGTTAVGSFRVGIYASTNSTISTSDTLLGYRTISGLGAGASSSGSGSFAINLATGSWWIGALADYLDGVAESDEGNNAMLSTSSSSQLSVITGPDLVVIQASHSPATVQAAQPITINGTVRNQGGSSAGSFSVGAYLSSNQSIDTGDVLIQNWSFSSLSAGGQATFGSNVVLNLPPGTWYIGLLVDYENSVAETSEGNNAMLSGSYGSQVVVTGPDLIGTSVTHTAGSVLQGSNVTVNFSIANQGSGYYLPFRVGVYVSSNSTVTTGDTLVAYDTLLLGLGGGSSYSNSRTFVPPLGTWYVGVIVDYLDACTETSESNNTRLSSSFNSRIIVQ